MGQQHAMLSWQGKFLQFQYQTHIPLESEVLEVFRSGFQARHINFGQDNVFSLLCLAMSSGVKGWARNTEQDWFLTGKYPFTIVCKTCNRQSQSTIIEWNKSQDCSPSLGCNWIVILSVKFTPWHLNSSWLCKANANLPPYL
jgi:hypothetical protein